MSWSNCKDMDVGIEIANLLLGEDTECKYAHTDPFDGGLRCCNGDSDWCTEYCPEHKCEFFKPKKAHKEANE